MKNKPASMKAKSINGKSTEEIQSALEQSRADDFTPKLAIVLVSIKKDRISIQKILSNAGIIIFGAIGNAYS